MEENEYESLGDGVGLYGSMIGGAVAGTAEHIIMYPVDSVKTRMQALKCEKKVAKSIFKNITNMMKEEGALRPMRGATVIITGSGPAHALYFSWYEQMKKVLATPRFSGVNEHVGHMVAGASATIFHDAIMTPAEAVKQRMQMCCSKYTKWTACAKDIYREEGPRAFYRAYTTQLSMSMPFQAIQFATYEFCKKYLNPAGKYDLQSHLLCGAIAGGVAAAVTNPLDVCKTLLNTQEPQLLHELNQSRVVGMYSAWKTVKDYAGYRGFAKGLTARIMFQAPSTAICWATYESLKHLISITSKSEDKYETLAELTQQPSLSAAATAGPSAHQPAADHEKGDQRLLEIITDLPRPLKALEVMRDTSASNSSLKYLDFPSIRTE